PVANVLHTNGVAGEVGPDLADQIVVGDHRLAGELHDDVPRLQPRLSGRPVLHDLGEPGADVGILALEAGERCVFRLFTDAAGLDQRIHDVRVAAVILNVDAAEIAGGQALGDARPRGAAIDALVDAAAR